jgi:hypothetical protein
MLVQGNAGLLDAAARCAKAEKGAAESEEERAHACKQVAFSSIDSNREFLIHVKAAAIAPRFGGGGLLAPS